MKKTALLLICALLIPRISLCNTQPSALNVTVDASHFNKNLNSSDTNQQLVDNAVDQLTSGGGSPSAPINSVQVNGGSGFSGNAGFVFIAPNVGIGTSVPNKLLSIGSTGQASIDSTGRIISVGLNNSGSAITNNQAYTQSGVSSNTMTGLLALSNPGTSLTTVSNVGIGSTNPGQILDVRGTVRMTGFNIASGSGSTKVLTSDGFGNGTWQNPTGGSSQWITTGNDIYYSLGNVGIGSQTVTDPLDVTSTVSNGQLASFTSTAMEGGGNAYVVINSPSATQGLFGVRSNGQSFFQSSGNDFRIEQNGGGLGFGEIDTLQSDTINSAGLESGYPYEIQGSPFVNENYQIVDNSGNVSYDVPNRIIYDSSGTAQLTVITSGVVANNYLEIDGTTFPQQYIINPNDSLTGFALSSADSSHRWQFYNYGSAGSHRFCFGEDGLSESFCMSDGSNSGLTVGSPYQGVTAPSNGMVVAGNIGLGTSLPSGILEVGARKFDIVSNGNVGIGSINPGQILDVKGTVRATAFIKSGGISSQFLKADGSVDSSTYITGNQTITLSGDTTGSGTTAITTTLKNTGTSGTYRSTTFDAQGRETSGTNPTTFSAYAISDTSADLASALTDEVGTGLSVFNNGPNFTGNIGIGTNTPLNRLDVQGTVNLKALEVTAAGNIGIGSLTPGQVLDVQGTIRASSSFISGTGSATITGVGNNVGIGSLNPGQALDVNGTVRMTGFSLPTNATSGYVLTSNSVGIGTWSPTTGGSGSVANPTATIGLTAVNGSATSAIRSDGAPALSQSITPMWTGLHIFNGTPSIETGGNVSIGTTNAANNSLSVLGNVSIGTTTAAPSLGLLVSGNVGIGTATAGAPLVVAGSGTIAATFPGNVGIGSTSPGQALDVNGTVRALSSGLCSYLYKCVGGVDAGVIQTSACNLCPAGTCTQMNGCF